MPNTQRVDIDEEGYASLSIASIDHITHMPSSALDVFIIQPSTNLVYTNPSFQKGDASYYLFKSHYQYHTQKLDSLIQRFRYQRQVDTIAIANQYLFSLERRRQASYVALLLLNSNLLQQQIQATLRCSTITTRLYPYIYLHSILCKGSSNLVLILYILLLLKRELLNHNRRQRLGYCEHLRLVVPFYVLYVLI